jgi:SanA protein
MKKVWRLLFFGLILCIGLSIFSYYQTASASSPFLFEKAESIPSQKVAVVLGTSRYLSNGHENLYFRYRMQAVFKLYQQGVIKYILVTGDNRKKGYNEPEEMQKALLEMGIPKDRIVMDFAGFRTLDSMVRAKEVFGLDEFICVSQKFHNERAVYLAKHFGIDVYGFNAKDVNHRYGFKTRVREVLARVKMMLDLYLFKTKPKFLGEEISIG